DPDVDEDYRQADLEVNEPVHDVRQQEVHRPKAQYRHDARREDNETVGGNSEDRGNRIDCEEQVGELDDDDYQQKWRGHAYAVFDGEELLAVVLRRNGDEP